MNPLGGTTAMHTVIYLDIGMTHWG